VVVVVAAAVAAVVVVWFSNFHLLLVIKINPDSDLFLTSLSQILKTLVPFSKCTYEHNSSLSLSLTHSNEV
jgi:hypothetical protein